jgi:2'-5' RNA ligase
MARLFVAIDLSDAARQAIAAEQERIVAAVVNVVNCENRVNRVNVANVRSGAVRCVRPDHLHVTLAFIGDVAESRAAAIVEAWAAPLAAAPFEVAFGGVGVFPSRGAPRVLWLGLTSGAEEVGAVQRLVAARLEAIGVAFEHAPFHPHLTLARWRRGSRLGRQGRQGRQRRQRRQRPQDFRRPRGSQDSQGRGSPRTLENQERAERLPCAADALRTVAVQSAAVIARLAVDEVTLFQSRLSPSGSVYTPLARARLAAASRPPLQ